MRWSRNRRNPHTPSNRPQAQWGSSRITAASPRSTSPTVGAPRPLACFHQEVPRQRHHGQGTMGGTGAKIYACSLEAQPPRANPSQARGSSPLSASSSPSGSLDLLRGSETTFRPNLLRAAHNTGDRGSSLPTIATRYWRHRPTEAGTNPTPAREGDPGTVSAPAGRPSTTSGRPTGWGLGRRAALPTFDTLRTLSRRSPESAATSKEDAERVGSPVVGLRPEGGDGHGRLPARPRPSVEHSYLFCPKEDPAEYHAGLFPQVFELRWLNVSGIGFGDVVVCIMTSVAVLLYD